MPALRCTPPSAPSSSGPEPKSLPEAGEAFRDTPSGGLLPLLRPSRQLSPGPLPAVLCRLAPSGGPLPLPRPSGPPVPQSFPASLLPAPLLPGPLPVLRLFRLPCFRPLSYVPAVLPFPMADRNRPVRFLFFYGILLSSPLPAAQRKSPPQNRYRKGIAEKQPPGEARRKRRLRENAADKSPDTAARTPQGRTPQARYREAPQRRRLREKRCGQAVSGKPSVRISPAHG